MDEINSPTPAAPAAPAAPAVPVAPAAPVAPAVSAEPAAPAPAPETRTVPLPVIEKMRSELQSTKAEREQMSQQLQLMREQMALYRANAPQAPAPQQHAPAPAAAAIADLLEGVPDSNLLEAGHVRKALKLQQQQFVGMIQDAVKSLQPQLAEIKLTQQVPQYQQLLKEQLPAIMQENPMFVEIIKSLPPEKQLPAAVQFAKMRADRMAAPPAVPQPAQAATGNIVDEINRIIENQAKPGNPGTGQATPAAAISLAARYASMPREEFLAEVERVKRGGAV